MTKWRITFLSNTVASSNYKPNMFNWPPT